jgi:hypothetical protein
MRTKLETRAYEDALERRLDDWGLRLDRFEIEQSMRTPGGSNGNGGGEGPEQSDRPTVRELLEIARNTLRELRSASAEDERQRLQGELDDLSHVIHRRIDDAHT